MTTKQPKLRVKATFNDKNDTKTAKIMEDYLNQEYTKYKDFVETVVRTRMKLEMLYGIKTHNSTWDPIVEAHVKQMIAMETK